ncbi:Asp23/Gls24 family envelope stress response protein [Kribbella sandramycini]|uniref:Asp23/Gls24 family envelope stress response protein n=1 Tax=Kribbella sandramycini TaxID=60450 RepID=A0A7Y4KX37_9ACTN|nr:Asp23/Gls24 family envelope stress response protein [Kribbella sandramycini]MBB6569923.1 putative alkaline shock family protein YloU [Kribbella sandramycini]NOL40253.1 Asp23/Gls24 family envelope stress response protein [Kribbella sandramycini]
MNATPQPIAKAKSAPQSAPESALVADSTGTPAGGKTTIADVVVSKIAGIATREIPGVHALGGGAARAVGLLRERIPGSKTNLSQGVSVEVGEKQAAVDIELVAEYGVGIADLAAAIRDNVITAVERMTGLEVTEVNIAVTDVHTDADDDADDEAAEPAERRVQ